MTTPTRARLKGIIANRRMSGRTWSKEEDVVLEGLVYRGVALRRIARHLHRSEDAIHKRMQELDLLKPYSQLVSRQPQEVSRFNDHWSEVELRELERRYYEGDPWSSLARRFNRTEDAVRIQVNNRRNEALGEDRYLGLHPRDKKQVWLRTGRYGPYVEHNGDTYSLTRIYYPDTMTLENALSLMRWRNQQ